MTFALEKYNKFDSSGQMFKIVIYWQRYAQEIKSKNGTTSVQKDCFKFSKKLEPKLFKRFVNRKEKKELKKTKKITNPNYFPLNSFKQSVSHIFVINLMI